MEQRFGHDYMENIYFHIIAFEAKLTSLKPATFDLGPFQPYHTTAFEQLWSTIQKKVWAQWRYENHFPHYIGPRFLSQPVASTATAVQLDANNDQVLSFCGGGKDSLVSMKLLEKANISYSTLTYSSSIYGRAATQHHLIQSLLNTVHPHRQHRLWMYEDF